MDNEINIMKHEKNNNRVIIIILILVILGLVGYIAYDKISTSNKETQKPTEEKENEKNNQSETEKPTEPTKENLSDVELSLLQGKIEILNDRFAKYIPLQDVNTIDSKVLLHAAVLELGYKDSYTKVEVEKMIKDLFGEEVNIQHQNVPCSFDDGFKCVALYLYNNKTETYTLNQNHPGHGGDARTSVYERYLNSEKVNNTYTIRYKLLYSNLLQDEGYIEKYYSSYDDAVKGQNALINLRFDESFGEYIRMDDDLFKTIENNVPTTTYVYEKNRNGVYNLKSITVD